MDYFRLKIVFLLRHALYLRNFESALRGLAEHGHEVVLVLSPLDKQVDTTLLESLTRECATIKQEPIGARTSWWWPASDGFRTLRDYLRYLEPEYHDAPALVDRGGRRLPRSVLWAFENVPGMQSLWARRCFAALATLIDRAIPPDPGLLKSLKRWSPDLLIVTPMIDFTYGQTDYVKAARFLGIPTMLAVASWDNLTNKGLIQVCPDSVLVWNAAQEREAVTMHGIPEDRIKKTGAQLYDHWFEMKPSVSRAEFALRAGGLNPNNPIILYLCSSSFICRDEVSFVKHWLQALRRTRGAVAQANVIVRPHPAHWQQWTGVDLSEVGNAVVWPRGGAVPVDDERKRDYFDSLFHADAVVGVNTSGFIEAGIIGRRTLAIKSGHFDATQEGTLHFRHLTEGGLLTVSTGFSQHFAELEDTIKNKELTTSRIRNFVADFVRPAGLNRPTTPIFIDAVEQGPATRQPWIVPSWAPLVRAAVWLPSGVLRQLVMARIKGGAIHGGIERTTFPRFLKPRGDSTTNSEARVKEFSNPTEDALRKIAESEKPIIVGPWLSEVGYELLYWIPLVRWAREAYGLDLDRLIVVSRGGVNEWYGELARRYVDLFDYFTPQEFIAFNAERQKASGMQKQKGIADVELDLVRRIEKDLGVGSCTLLHPRLMYSGLLRYHWSQRSSMDHLLLHARYEPMPVPEPSDIEARLPSDYYAVRFYARESFEDSEGNRQFVRQIIEGMLERRDVVLLDSPFAVDDHTNVEWMRAAGNGSCYSNRLMRADDWMVPRNNLDVQSRIIARSHCFVGTYGGLSYLAPFYGKPTIAFHQSKTDVMDAHVNTAMTIFRGLGASFVLLTPSEAHLVADVL
jgi:hypothetical protein